MCNKSGSPPVPNQTSTAYQSATAPSSFVQPYYQAFLQNAQQLQGTPFNPAMEGTLAPLNDYQTQAGNALFQLGLSQAGGFPGVTDAANALSAYGGTMGTFDPNMLNQVMSPFTEDVVGATQNWFNNQNQIQSNDLLSQAIRSGNAFGGDRAGVAQAQLAGQQQLAQAPVIAGLRQAGYTQALDEYNQLKQMGLGGLQAGLGAQVTSAQAPTIAQQELMTGLGFGNQVQQQQQRGYDIAQQNAMMASAYPFQVQNWYGSTLGGLGPLLGSFAQGYTTPPQPNELTQGLGIASSLVGLGNTLFGSSGSSGTSQRRGGVVGRPPMRRHVGGLVPVLARGGGLTRTRWAPPGTLGRRLPARRAAGGDSGDDQMDTGATNINVTGGMPFRSNFNLSPMSSMSAMNVPQFKAPTDAQDFMDRMKRQSQKQQGQTNPNDLASTIKNFATTAAKAAPLFALLNKGGDVHYRADGGDDDDDDDDDQEDTSRADMPTLIQAGYRPPQPVAQQSSVFTPGALEETQGGSPAGLPVQASEAPEFAPTPAGYRGGAGTQTYPGLGPPPRTFAQRLANDPFWNAGAAMLMSRSPYFGAGLGAGMMAASGAAERSRKEDLLDNRPQMLDDGKNVHYRVGNKIIRTSIRSPKAVAAEQAEAKRQQKREETWQDWQRKEEYKRQYKQPGADKTDATIDKLIKQEMDAAKAAGTPITAEEAEYAARERYNKRHPDRPLELPAKPEPKPPALGPKVPDPRPWYDFTSPDPNSKEAREERGRQAREDWEKRRAGAAPAPAPAPAPAQPAPAQPAQPAPQQAAPADPVQGMKDAITKGGDQARQRIIAQAQAAIKANPANEAEVRRRLKAAGIEMP